MKWKRFYLFIFMISHLTRTHKGPSDRMLLHQFISVHVHDQRNQKVPAVTHTNIDFIQMRRAQEKPPYWPAAWQPQIS